MKHKGEWQTVIGNFAISSSLTIFEDTFAVLLLAFSMLNFAVLLFAVSMLNSQVKLRNSLVVTIT